MQLRLTPHDIDDLPRLYDKVTGFAEEWSVEAHQEETCVVVTGGLDDQPAFEGIVGEVILTTGIRIANAVLD